MLLLEEAEHTIFVAVSSYSGKEAIAEKGEGDAADSKKSAKKRSKALLGPLLYFPILCFSFSC